LFCTHIYSQSNITIKGSVTDTLGTPLIQATVLLLEKSDSTMVAYTRCEMDGSFKFKEVDKGDYVVKSTYVGFLPLVTPANTMAGDNLDLGQIKMTELAEELMTVVIKAAKAPIVMRGDTIEYDASTFKVPEGSTVEDLLRRLPGIEVEQDGSILADGKDVNKVTVDGKSFFGSDPKAATKNLPAEGISKVQVYDTETAEEEVTGIKSADSDKTLNLELKEEFKKGGFGKIVGGLGTSERAELKGNYNKFNDKLQFSLVGVGNNTGRNGLSWDDYRDFMGSQAFNFGNAEEIGFGGGGGGRYFTFGGGDNGIESSIRSLFFNGGNSGGLPLNYNGGASLNYEHKKTKISSVYYYNQQGLNKETTMDQSRFYDDFTSEEQAEEQNESNFQGHRMELSYEQEIDTLHSFKITANAAFIDQKMVETETANLFRNGILNSESNFKNDTDKNGYLGDVSFLFRKKFKRKGRRAGVNFSYLGTELETDELQNSTSEFKLKDSIEVLNYQNEDVASKNVFKFNAVYVEPFGKKFYWQTFYNYSNRSEAGERLVKESQEVEGFLSRNFENDILLNRVGSSLRYSHKGYNVTAGLAYQNYDLNGDFTSQNELITGMVDKQFNNWLPYLSVDISPQRNLFMSAGYGRQATEPSIADLQPIIDTRNPFYIREGNLDLTPELSDRYSISGNKNWPLAAVRISLSLDYTRFQSQFSTSETVDEDLVTYLRPINVEGGEERGVWSNLSFPIVKNKFTVRTYFRYSLGSRPSLVNNIENVTRREAFRPSFRLSFTPNSNFSLSSDCRFNITNTEYDINTSQNQRIINNNYNVTLNTKLVAKIFGSTSFNYSTNVNERFSFEENVPILNASLYRNFLPENKLEVRISAYDLLGRSQNISQSTFGNSVFFSRSNVIGRYFMLSLSYNIRGMKGGIEKNRWW